MTYEEQQQYNKLSYKQQQRYNEYRKDKPHWGHGQIMAKIAFIEKLDKTIDNGGKDVDSNSPVIWKEIFESVKNFLKRIDISGSIIKMIDQALETLGDLIYRGITSISNAFLKIWDWIF